MTTSENSLPSEQHDDADPVIDALLVEVVPSDPARKKRPPNLSNQIVSQLDGTNCNTSAKISDDADPMIDTLLAEFVPSDPSGRKSPPDLSAKILEQLAKAKQRPAVEKTDDADPMVDALLAEFISMDSNKRKSPPDLSAQILAQLDTAPVTETTTNPVSREVSIESWSPARVASLIATLAACLVGAIWLLGNSDDPSGLTDSGSEPSMLAQADTHEAPSVTLDPNGTPKIGGMEFSQDLASAANNSTAGNAQGSPSGNPLGHRSVAKDSGQGSGSAKAVAPLNVVAATASATARDYWKSLGITPTPEASSSVIASRLKSRLGVVFPEETLADPQRLRNVLAQSSNSAEIAKRWLALTTGNSLDAIARPEKADLVNELSRGVTGESPFDVTLVSLIDGSSDHSKNWYETIARGGTEGIAKQLASVSMNADLRCVKCHDSRIGRSGTQDDYWSFVALVRNVIQRTDNRWVLSNQPKPTSTFFELPDGRQRLAQARVSGHLLQSAQGISDFKAWTKTLLGNRALASSVVDSLWKLVHGRKLKPSPVDAFAPPVDGNLNQLHALLAQDLIDSQFDVARTLALIIASPMATRSVPEALRGNAVLTTTDQQRSAALELVGAFAASVEAPQSSQKQRVDVAMRRVGGRLNTGNQGTLLAQPIYNDPAAAKNPSQPTGTTPAVSFSEQLSVDFPASGSSLPVSWLRSINDFDQQVQHLVYLSGQTSVSAEIKDAAERLKKADGEESALSRVWWILRN